MANNTPFKLLKVAKKLYRYDDSRPHPVARVHAKE
tara:strand:+ start:435 stop:539 length:105 start_codon:yes stop_codon:yes gene_type:complete